MIDIGRINGIVVLQQVIEFVQDPTGEVPVDLVAVDEKRVIAGLDADAERSFEQLDVLVVVSEKSLKVPVIVEGELEDVCGRGGRTVLHL